MPGDLDIALATSKRVSEAELLARAREGDCEAFAGLWRLHRGAALTVARRLAQADAEDVVAEAFTSIWDQMRCGKGPRQHFRAYLLTVVRNIAARWHRNRLPLTPEGELEVEGAPDTEARYELDDDRRIAALAFNSLSDRWQEVLWTLEIEKTSRAEAAEQLGMKPNSLSVLLRRAKDGFRVAWLTQFTPSDREGSHPDIVADLPKYVCGVLSADASAYIAMHLSACTECREVEGLLASARPRSGVSLGLAVATGAIACPALLSSGPGHAWAAVQSGSTTLAAASGEAATTAGWLGTLKSAGFVKLLGASAAAVVGAALILPFVLSNKPEAVPAEPAGEEASSVIPPASSPEESAESAASPSPSIEDSPNSESAEPSGSTDNGSQDPLPHESDEAAGDSGNSSDTSVSVKVKSLTASGSDADEGAFAPLLAGAAQPASSVSLTVASQTFQVDMPSGGYWQFDLAGIGLAPGSYVATVTQKYSGAKDQTVRVPFEVTLPSVQSYQISGSNVQLRILGIPGSQVCVTLNSGSFSRVKLDGTGEASLKVPLSGSSSYDYRYCRGSRFGAVATFAL